GGGVLRLGIERPEHGDGGAHRVHRMAGHGQGVQRLLHGGVERAVGVEALFQGGELVRAGQLPAPQQMRDRLEGLRRGELRDGVAAVEQGVRLRVHLRDRGDVGDHAVQPLADLRCRGRLRGPGGGGRGAHAVTLGSTSVSGQVVQIREGRSAGYSCAVGTSKSKTEESKRLYSSYSTSSYSRARVSISGTWDSWVPEARIVSSTRSAAPIAARSRVTG